MWEFRPQTLKAYNLNLDIVHLKLYNPNREITATLWKYYSFHMFYQNPSLRVYKPPYWWEDLIIFTWFYFRVKNIPHEVVWVIILYSLSRFILKKPLVPQLSFFAIFWVHFPSHLMRVYLVLFKKILAKIPQLLWLVSTRSFQTIQHEPQAVYVAGPSGGQHHFRLTRSRQKYWFYSLIHKEENVKWYVLGW